MSTPHQKIRFAICMIGDEPDLEQGKVYKVLPDPEAERTHWIRVVDESEEDYLYPANCFAFVELPRQAKKLLFTPSSRIVKPKPIRQRSATKSA